MAAHLAAPPDIPPATSPGELNPFLSEHVPLSTLTPLAPNTGVRARDENSIPRRPKLFHYTISTLSRIPRRLFRPPKSSSVLVKKWSLVPEIHVTLDEILNMRHQSPLGLKDFEEYLLFEEYSAENLYFILWLNDYTRRYDADTPPAQLAYSVARAKVTFLSPGSQYELNLTDDRLENFHTAIGGNRSSDKTLPTQSVCSTAPSSSSTAPPPLNPSALTGIRDDIDDLLRNSARQFVRARSRNASKTRIRCAFYVGSHLLLYALAPLLMSVLRHRGRWVRFGMIPPLFFGLSIILCALRGICFAIWMVAGSRQLHAFELARPSISAPVPQRSSLPYEHSFSTAETLPNFKSQPHAYPPKSLSSRRLSFPGPATQRPDAPALPPVRPTSSLGDIFEFETASFIPAHQDARSERGAVSAVVSSPPDTVRGPQLLFDFDALPAKTLDSTTGPPTLHRAEGRGAKRVFWAIFRDLTEVRSETISRAQWEIVIRSMAVAAVVVAVVMGILISAPF